MNKQKPRKEQAERGEERVAEKTRRNTQRGKRLIKQGGRAKGGIRRRTSLGVDAAHPRPTPQTLPSTPQRILGGWGGCGFGRRRAQEVGTLHSRGGHSSPARLSCVRSAVAQRELLPQRQPGNQPQSVRATNGHCGLRESTTPQPPIGPVEERP